MADLDLDDPSAVVVAAARALRDAGIDALVYGGLALARALAGRLDEALVAIEARALAGEISEHDVLGRLRAIGFELRAD
jgi:hypothetical protein